MYIKLLKQSEVQSSNYSKAVYRVAIYEVPLICTKGQLIKIMDAFKHSSVISYTNGKVDIYFYVSGSTTCNPLDEYDELKGRDQAENKAIKKAYQQALTILRAMKRCMNNNLNVIDDFAESVSDKYYKRKDYDLK